MGYDTIFAELLLLATLRWAVRTAGGTPEGRQVDDLIDELGEQLMRHRDAIDGELRLIAALRRAARRHGGQTPADDRINDLLDERLSAGRTPVDADESRIS
jgi:hypothetical protein